MITALDHSTALVLIDLQNGILQLPVVDSTDTVLANANKLIAAFRQAALPIILVNVDPTQAVQYLRAEAKRPGGNLTITPEWLALAPMLNTEPSDVRITKPTWGAFSNPSFDEELKKRKVTGIVLAGISTSIGVESTARTAFERGYNITFAQDAMTDMVASAQANSLKVIFPRIGEVDTTENIVNMLGALNTVA
ncbi:isochorismatase family protein [Hymenobacter sp. GOD-10R]|uniref:isochorismatase family protein n=1 Tax=Hymenobacter sp. GOD-10R TaxID=3093922 RepID=UPI002D798208|nr:isochorismatase family protein [Hymenobacter sp. GOD-10R]WRQ29518.1 isochorismatase family protein [Hymenobacter sp. GOD-10R]